MKKANYLILALQLVGMLVVFVLFSLLAACTEQAPEMKSEPIEAKTDLAKEIIWHIKALHPEGRTIDVKALDKDGNVYDVKAIQDTEQKQLMDIKALVGEKRLPVKILVSEDQYAPIKAITDDGTLYDIKAITPEGDKLDVKGVNRSGNILDIKAIDGEGIFYGIKAISPAGQLNDVKGVKMMKEPLESIVNGVEVLAHVKSLPQIGAVKGSAVWHVKAFHPEGKAIDVKAIDKDGNIYAVKAIQDFEQRHLMDIKALMGEQELPVKMLVSDDQYAPVKAIGSGGTIYDIKAITSEGDKLDVKGVNRSGNIIDIKAIDKTGAFYGVKAISPDGELNDVKGVKMVKERLELKLNGVEVHAHIKALPQVN